MPDLPVPELALAPAQPSAEGSVVHRSQGAANIGRYRSSIAFLVLFLLANLLVFVGSLNPDWDAYQELLQTGAWLADQGRDPGFLAITDMYKATFGNGYEYFRIWVGIYFVAFTLWAAGRWRMSAELNLPLLSFVGLLPLFLLKFTVQIREGISTTLVFAALTLMFHAERRATGVRFLVLPVLLILTASTIHGAAGITLLILSAVPVFLWCGNLVGVKTDRTALYWAGVALACAIWAAFAYAEQISDVLIEYVALQWAGWEQLDVEVNDGKLGYWSFKALCAVYLVLAIKRITPLHLEKRLFMGYLKLGGYLVVPLLQAAILYFVWTGQSAYLTSVVIRAYQTVYFMLFAMVMLLQRKTTLSLLLVAFFLLDDYRVVLAGI